MFAVNGLEYHQKITKKKKIENSDVKYAHDIYSENKKTYHRPVNSYVGYKAGQPVAMVMRLTALVARWLFGDNQKSQYHDTKVLQYNPLIND